MTIAHDGSPAAAPDQTSDPLAIALSDPQVRASLAVIAAHAPELAVMVSAGNGLLGRSRDIMDNINGRVEMLRETPGASEAVTRYTDLATSLAEATPTIDAFLNSAILRPEIVEIIGKVGEAAFEADRATSGKKLEVGGLFALLRELRDPQVQETLAFLITFAKAFGREQTRPDVPNASGSKGA